MRKTHTIMQSEFDELIFSAQKYWLACLLHEKDTGLIAERKNILILKARNLIQKYPIHDGPRYGGELLTNTKFPDNLTHRPENISSVLNNDPSLLYKEMDRCTEILASSVNHYFHTDYSHKESHSIADHLKYYSNETARIGLYAGITSTILSLYGHSRGSNSRIGTDPLSTMLFISAVSISLYSIKNAVYDAYKLFQAPAKPTLPDNSRKFYAL